MLRKLHDTCAAHNVGMAVMLASNVSACYSTFGAPQSEAAAAFVHLQPQIIFLLKSVLSAFWGCVRYLYEETELGA